MTENQKSKVEGQKSKLLLFAFCLFLFAGLCGAFLAAPPPPRLSVRTYYDFARRELRVNRSLAPVPSGTGLAAGPGPSTLTPNDLDQVSTSVFDPVNNAIRVYALLSPGGTHTPNNGDQVFTSIFNATNNAIQVNCVFGCGGTPVNVATDSQGWASIGSCTIGLTNASNTATASSANCFASANVGAILQYNSGTAPNFRAVIIGVSGTTLTLSTYYPGATASGIAYASGLTSGTYNFVADACGQINASILNHPGLAIDAGGLTGQPNCTVSPWNGLAYANATTGGVLRLGATWYTVARQWFIPGGWDVGGFGKYAASASSTINTALLADTSNYIPAVYEASAVVSTNVVTTQGTSTFADHPSSGNSTLMQTVASTSCIGSTNFGIITLNSALTGFYDSSQIHIQGVTGNTGWNGTWMLTAVNGLAGMVQFNSTCPTPGTLSGATVDLLIGDQVQGSFVVSTSGTISSSGSGPAWAVTDSSSEFAATDVGSCTIKCTGAGCNGNTGPYTVVANSSGTVDQILTTASLSWTSQTFQKTCWVQGTVTATSFNSGTQTATLTANIPMQQTCSGCSMTYSIGGGLLSAISYSGAGSIQGINIHDLVVSMNGLADSTALQAANMQEQGSLARLGLSGWTAYGIDAEIGSAHHGPWSTLQLGASSAAPPTSACIQIVSGSDNSPRGIDGVTCVANNNGSDPYAGVELAATNVTIKSLHCERFGACISVGRYNGVQKAKGNAIISSDPGIGVAYGVHFWSGNVMATVSGLWETNGPPAALILDDNVNASCGSGSTLLTENGATAPGIAFYYIQVGNSGTTRFTSDPGANNCLGTTNVSASIPAGYTVASLPTCNAAETGAFANVTNNNAACAYGGTPTGGGSTECPVWCNGSSWVIH